MSFKKLYDSSPSELKKIVVDQWKAKQNPKWHPEGNTLKHIITVTNRAFRDFPDNKDIQLAAYFHDLGKLATYKVNPKTGEPTAYGHEKESTDLIDKFSDFVKKQGADPEIVKYIVINHMKIKPSTWDVMKPSKKDDIINSPHYKDLEKFGTIDKGGLLELKYTNSKDKKTKKFITEISRFQKLAGIKSNFSLLNESTDQQKEERVYNLFYNETQHFTGIRNYETGSDSDWDKVKDYIQKEKQNFLYNNKDISEEEFDAYYDKFLDYIEEQRGYESRNQQDLKMSFPWN